MSFGSIQSRSSTPTPSSQSTNMFLHLAVLDYINKSKSKNILTASIDDKSKRHRAKLKEIPTFCNVKRSINFGRYHNNQETSSIWEVSPHTRGNSESPKDRLKECRKHFTKIPKLEERDFSFRHKSAMHINPKTFHRRSTDFSTFNNASIKLHGKGPFNSPLRNRK
ncbi:unnamed protein product [Blepharisma stoltei]|uniref:Uncharacterized protein n=1 Tax=Blepharisma stoltei TaxID=1481888 RepID=A0AAU9JQ34_9CILI|nr:unnamed protein product [Blepharisma stoltei]